jgi:hypothetical protein
MESGFSRRGEEEIGGTYTRTNVEKKPKVDVGDATSSVDHDVSVVAVLDLDDVTEERVGSHRLDEVGTGALEVGRVGRAVLHYEEGLEVVDLGTTHLVTGGSVRYDVDDTALRKERSAWDGGEGSERNAPQVQSR